ncbi:hypothetical protein GCM10010525_21570 [Glutamicibacter bergerei]
MALTEDNLQNFEVKLDKISTYNARVNDYINSIQDEITLHRSTLQRAIVTEIELDHFKADLVSREYVSNRLNEIQGKLERDMLAKRSSDLRRLLSIVSKLDECEGIFSSEDLAQLATDLREIPALIASWIYIANDAVSMLPLREKRRLASATRQLGYWSVSNVLLESVVKDTRSERDQAALNLRSDEVEVFMGMRDPYLKIDTESYLPIHGHILHVVGKVLPKTQSGYTLRTHYSARAQIKVGYKASVVALIGEAEDSASRTLENIDGIDYYSLAGEPRNKQKLSLWLQENVEQLAALVVEIRPSALHAHSDFLNAYVARVVANTFNIPLVYESRGFWEESWLSRISQTCEIQDWHETGRHFGLPDAYKLRKQMEIRMRSEADHVITLANVMKSHIVDLGGSENDITVIPNAVDAADFPVTEPKLTLLDDLGIPRGATVIGYISSIVEYEGIDVLIRAFNSRSKEDLADAHLLIVGDGLELEALKELVRTLGTPRVHFTGRVPHASILGFYSVIDVFVVPRRPAEVCHLVTPLKPFEAFSTGRAVIMSDVRALKEIASQGKCARLFVAGDYESLADELVYLANDNNAREELGAKAASWVRAERSWAKNALAYSKVYELLGIQNYNDLPGAAGK